MFDAKLRPLIDPPLNRLGQWIARHGVSANTITLIAGIVGIGAGLAAAYGLYAVALGLIILNRLGDGVDGAVARATQPSDFGGYLDIVADFTFYVAVPLGFAAAVPANLPYAAALIASFTLTGVSFLAFASIAAKRGMETSAHGAKSFFYSTGLAEGAETIAVLAAMCVFPGQFATIAMAYTALCLLTLVQRSILAWFSFRP